MHEFPDLENGRAVVQASPIRRLVQGSPRTSNAEFSKRLANSLQKEGEAIQVAIRGLNDLAKSIQDLQQQHVVLVAEVQGIPQELQEPVGSPVSGRMSRKSYRMSRSLSLSVSRIRTSSMLSLTPCSGATTEHGSDIEDLARVTGAATGRSNRTRRTHQPHDKDACHNKDGVLSTGSDRFLAASEATQTSTSGLCCGCWASFRSTLKPILESKQMECFVGFLILANVALLAVETQFDGQEVAHKISFHNATAPPQEPIVVMHSLDFIIGAVFAVEVALKFLVLGRKSLVFAQFVDALVVTVWIVELILMHTVFDNHSNYSNLDCYIRVLRLVRVAGALRVLKWGVDFFDPLHIILGSIHSSIRILFWAFVLLMIAMTVMAILMSNFMTTWLKEWGHKSSQEDKTKLFAAWGNFVRAIVTMFEITLANWGPPCHLLMEKVHPLWGLAFVVYKSTFGLAVVQVIMSVFTQQTFKTASQDEVLMIKEKSQAFKATGDLLTSLFNLIDQFGDADGSISKEEFQKACADKHVKTFMAALEVDVKEAEDVFKILDKNGDGIISTEEFQEGLRSIKGNAKALDMLIMGNKLNHIEGSLRRLSKK